MCGTFFIVSIGYSFVLYMALNYAVFCVCVLYILYVSSMLLIFIHDIQHLARMRDKSSLIDILDDDVHVHSTDFTDGICSGMVDVASTITSSGWVPITCVFVGYLFNCLLYQMSAHVLSRFL